MQLLFQLHEEFVDDAQDDVFVQRTEADNGIQTIAELWREHTLDIRHFITCLLGFGETHGALLQALCAGVRRHDDDHIAEVCLATIVVCQRAVIHHLQ